MEGNRYPREQFFPRETGRVEVFENLISHCHPEHTLLQKHRKISGSPKLTSLCIFWKENIVGKLTNINQFRHTNKSDEAQTEKG